jgi:hypothetical protein
MQLTTVLYHFLTFTTKYSVRTNFFHACHMPREFLPIFLFAASVQIFGLVEENPWTINFAYEKHGKPGQ